MLQAFILGFVGVITISLCLAIGLKTDDEGMKICEQYHSYDYCFTKLHN